VSARASWWWWTEQPQEAKPIDWAAVGRAAQVAARAAAEHWRIAERTNIPIISENVAAFALWAAMAAVCSHVGRERVAPGAMPPNAAQPVAEPLDRELREAAQLLGVSLPDSMEEIRRAFFKKLVDERIHPDHGGDAELTKKVIAARDLLVARCKVRS
jgi:hypothetical protein